MPLDGSSQSSVGTADIGLLSGLVLAGVTITGYVICRCKDGCEANGFLFGTIITSLAAPCTGYVLGAFFDCYQQGAAGEETLLGASAETPAPNIQ